MVFFEVIYSSFHPEEGDTLLAQHTKIHLTSSISNEHGSLQFRSATSLSMWATSKGGSFLGLSLAGISHAGEEWGCFATRCHEAQAFPDGVGEHWNVGYAEAPLSLGVCSWVRQPNATCAEKPPWTVPLSAISAQEQGCTFVLGRMASPGASEPCLSSVVCREALFRS